jgi:hypothetical protein
MNHIENNKILYELQHGFRHNRSRETQLLSFIQELSETDSKNIQTDLIIMDFAKALFFENSTTDIVWAGSFMRIDVG